MSLAYRFLGWGYVAACGAIIGLLGQRSEPAAAVDPASVALQPAPQPIHTTPAPAGDDAASNGLEVLGRLNDGKNVELERTRPQEPGA